MTLKSDLIKRMARRNPTLGEAVIAQILNIFFDAILHHIREESRVELRGFGSFSSRSYNLKSSHLGLSKLSYKRMYFRPSEKLIKAVNASSNKSDG
ncbi:HU family DNA-binding protein [Candidatus Anaplasma sp. TIGMIC]|uniref:HU family DNA-binding protein n=1 Tax=Candidatus Anaplasma sp. TIGMIC TaxID=3020713 RepID=UPI00233007B8|nr:HU family DNA-binding protein [Candidatus Anaplasma sp. TIGMIC]MDB1135209.1 HU family DNA-binding protein [Candidatus Anaplasma sp. TIGMIC]